MLSHSRGAPRILVVRPGALGDTILTLPLLESIRLHDPTANITFLGTRSYGDLIPKWTEFQPMDDPRWLWMFAPDGAELTECHHSFGNAYVVLNKPDDVIRNLTRAGVRSVFHTSSRPQPGEHVVEHMHRGLGLPVPVKSPMLSHLASRKEKLIWIHPGSGGPGKCVPLDFLIRFVDALAAVKGWPTAITVGEEDAFLRKQPGWKTLISGPHTRLLEQRPLGELYTALGSASLFIGNDCGISHMAAALGIPSIIFFVSTDPSQWTPWVPADQVRIIDLSGDLATSADVQKLASQLCSFLHSQSCVP